MSASEQDRVAGFDAQRGDVDGDVGARLVDHAEHADGHAHLLQAQAVLQMVSAYDLAHRVGQGRHVAHALGRGFDAWDVELEPVEFARVHAVFGGLAHVERVGPRDGVGVRVERVGHRFEQPVLRRGVGLGQSGLRAACGVAHPAYRLEHVGVYGSGLVLWIRHSSLG